MRVLPRGGRVEVGALTTTFDQPQKFYVSFRFVWLTKIKSRSQIRTFRNEMGVFSTEKGG